MAYEAEFAEFWSAYPLKRDRLDALKAYQKARKGGATHAQILAGVGAYVANKPRWQDFKHAATWLNKGGYLDEWNADGRPAATTPKRDWYEECGELHNHECGLDRYRHMTRLEAERMKTAGLL